MSHYGHKSIPDAKFESDSSSSFGDMTSQNFPRKKGTSHEIDPPCQFQQFSSIGKIFHFQNFWDVSMRKEQQQPP